MSKLKKWFKENITTDRIAIITLLFAILGIFYLPHWVTQKSWEYDLGETEPNEIADTIGGILGPFISFISACLVYLALREQINANKLIQKQFKKEKKAKFEREIYQEALNEIDAAISIFKKFDGSSLKRKVNYKQQPITYYEIMSELFLASIYEKSENTHDETEITLFIDNLKKMVDSLTLFTDNVSNEKAFLQIIKRRIEKIYEIWNLTDLIKERNDIIELEKKTSSILNLSKSDNFELIIRLLQIEKKLLERLKVSDLEIIDIQLEWYEINLSDLKEILRLKNQYDKQVMNSIGFQIYSDKRSSTTDISILNSLSKERQERLQLLLEKKNEFNEFVKKLGKSNIQYQLPELIP